MKPKLIIIPIVIVAFLAVYFIADNAEITSLDAIGENTSKIPHFNCAEIFDQTVELPEKYMEPTAKEMEQGLFEGIELFVDLNENRCFITIEQWTVDSKYEQEINDADGINTVWSNKLLIGEIKPSNSQEQERVNQYIASKKAIKLTDNYQDYLKLHAKLLMNLES